MSTTMAHAQHTVTINRPIDDVFAYLADGANNPHWRPGVLEIHRTSKTDGPGATFQQTLTGSGGRRISGDYRITTHTPPTLLEFEVTAGPARPTGRFDLSEPTPGHTTVTFTLDLASRGLMRLMSTMITKQMRAEVQQLDQLKHNLEH